LQGGTTNCPEGGKNTVRLHIVKYDLIAAGLIVGFTFMLKETAIRPSAFGLLPIDFVLLLTYTATHDTK